MRKQKEKCQLHQQQYQNIVGWGNICTDCSLPPLGLGAGSLWNVIHMQNILIDICFLP
jgi:hypothetical protein